ncbi:MAG: response regulator [Elusimicrobia bacterium]|nr:response regulator [Elusimicrobiota bacterium]
MRTSTRTSILIVEDDDHFRETLVDAMALKNIEAVGVGTGALALSRLKEQVPSLIILDVQLPDMHGFEICRQLRRMPELAEVPIVFLSARYTEPADRAEGLLAGADAFLSKPVNLEALWEEVQYLLDRKP